MMNNYVYHGSSISGLKSLKPSKSTHNKLWVYASKTREAAVIFISNKGSDLYYDLSSNNDLIELTERKEGMFENIFNVSGSIYYLNPDNFIDNQTGWSMEVVSDKEVNIIKEEHIDNVYDEIIKLSNEGRIKLYLYPERPDRIPLDNNDLIPRVKRWEKNGYNVQKFFDLYPELVDKYKE